VAGLVALFVTNWLGAMIPSMIGRCIDILAGSNQQIQAAGIEHILLSILGLAVVILVARVLSRVYLIGAGQKIEYDLREKLYAHLLKMPPQYYAANPAGELMSRMVNDVESLRMMTAGGMMLGFNTIFVYITILPVMIRINPWLTVLTFLLYPAAVVVLSKITAKFKDQYYQVQQVLGEISATVQENFTGINVIQAYGLEGIENDRLARQSDQYFKAYRSVIGNWVLLAMIFVILGGVSYLITLLAGGWRVIDKQMSLGDLIAFTLCLERIIWPTGMLGWILSTIQQGMAALARVDDVLSRQPDITSPAKPASLPTVVEGRLEFRHMTFAYHNPYLKEDNDSHPILSGINLTIQPGQTVAIVGAIGSGKSTLLRLIPRLYDVPVNTIFLDGVDITTLTLTALREQIVMMSQQSFLFSTTVSENIAFIEPDTQHPEIKGMADIAAIHEEILALPQRYDTLVGERGVMLSGGQRQRVSLARALLKANSAIKPAVMILDDPFSNVDAETEEKIIAALEARRALANKTTIFVTHRFSLVPQADWVILMDEGKVIATGTHNELLAREPLYQRLNQQAQHQESVPPDEAVWTA